MKGPQETIVVSQSAEHTAGAAGVSGNRDDVSSLRRILEHLPAVLVYVVGEGDNRILFRNKRAAKSFPELRPGMDCRGVFRQEEQSCLFHPGGLPGRNAVADAVLRNTPFGAETKAAVLSVLWENGTPAYAVLIPASAVAGTDRGTRWRTLALGLCAPYEYVAALDLDTGRYKILAAGNAGRHIPREGDYETVHRHTIAPHVAPSCREAFLAVFSLESLDSAFQEGNCRITLEYKVNADGESFWKRRSVYPLESGRDERHMLVCVSDITVEKGKELRVRKDLPDSPSRSRYVEIYRMNREADRVECLFCNTAFFDPWDARGDFRAIIGKAAAELVHPEDRTRFLRLHEPLSVGRPPEKSGKEAVEYRRAARRGEYRWVSSFFVPLPGDSGDVLILVSDSTDRREMETAARRLERRYNAIFRQSCDVVWEVDLASGQYVRTPHRVDRFAVPLEAGDYATAFRMIVKNGVHADDQQLVRDVLSLEALRRAWEERRTERACQYRLRVEGREVWLESRLFFLEGEDAATAFILIRDISSEKRQEAERELEEQRLHAALRDTYTELCEIDLEQNTFRLLFFNSPLLLSLEEIKGEDLRGVAERLIHPGDRARIMATFHGSTLRACFERGSAEVPEEYRRLGKDGAYHWVSAVVVPLRSRTAGGKALLLVKDISERKAQEQRQRMAEQYDRALRQIYDELYELNITQNTYRIVYHVRNKYVTPPEQGILADAVALVADEMICPEDRRRFLEFFDMENVRRSFAVGQESRIGEFRKLWVDGAYHWSSLIMFPLPAEEDGDERYLVFIMDIEAKKQAEEIAQQNVLLERQRIADARYRFIMEQTGTLVFEWCLETNSLFLSPEIPQRFAGTYDGRDLIRVWKEDAVIHQEDRRRLNTFVEDIEKGANRAEMTVRFRTLRGGFLWCKVAVACLRDEQGHAHRYIGTLNDVDEATRSMLALKYRAEFDTLTGIYNAQTFYSRAAVLLQRHRDRAYSIIRVDIDRFKVVNELYGTGEGDKLLRAIAGLLEETLSGRGVYGRIASDIFCVCVDYDRAGILNFVREITERLAEYPLSYKVLPFFGICRVDSIDTPVDILCDRANLALRTVKGNYITRYAFYDGKLREQVLEEKKIESEMHDALVRGQFSMYLQPKVHIPTSRIVGAEGLVRWRHPEEGRISPDRFIPLFERNGFIIRLDEYIWEQACMTLRRWIDNGWEPVPISVNVSRLHIHDAGFCDKLLELVRKYAVPPPLLRLELTESSFLENEDKLLQAMQRLQRHGFRFSIDDFGSGYSSLNMLKVLPIDGIKLDRGFFSEVVSTEQGKTVIRCTISMAREMHLKVISEGVENVGQAVFLLQAGCCHAQGFFYSRAVPAADFEALAFGPQQPPFPVPPEVEAVVAAAPQLREI